MSNLLAPGLVDDAPIISVWHYYVLGKRKIWIDQIKSVIGRQAGGPSEATVWRVGKGWINHLEILDSLMFETEG